MKTSIVIVCIIVLLVGVFQTSAESVSPEHLVNYNVPNPCYKWEDVSPYSVIDARRIRQAHCEPIGEAVQAQPIAQKPMCESLWLYTGEMYVGMPTGAGGVVTAMSGEWVIDVRGHVLMAKGGKSFTVSFPHDVNVQQLAILDNDPAMGESGWSLNGIALPITADHETKAILDFNLATSAITFDHGQDSPHIGMCVLS
jgi:hypothetical protein